MFSVKLSSFDPPIKHANTTLRKSDERFNLENVYIYGLMSIQTKQYLDKLFFF